MFELIKQFLSKEKASRKSRRRVNESQFRLAIQSGWACRASIFALFIAGLAVISFTGNSPAPFKNFFAFLLILLAATGQLWINHPQTAFSNARLSLLLSSIFFQILAFKALLLQGEHGRIDPRLIPVLLPYALAPMVLSVVFRKQHGLYAAVFCSLWAAFLPPTMDPALLLISLTSGFVAVYATFQVRRRGRLIRAGIYVGATTFLLACLLGQIGPISWASPADTNWKLVAIQSLAAFGSGIVTAMLVSGLLPILESVFGVTTDISWLEMADLNHPLLKRLSMEAPGTYHHSLAVANLAEAAAEKIGANPTICRVSSYFHDIGKLVKPEYFTENIRQGENPHDALTPTLSALIIISHVKEGVDLAIKHHLNPLVIDGIREHHGTSRLEYFYQRALSQKKDAELGSKIMNLRSDDIPEVDRSTFLYPGPRPRTKETAILSLADSVESASRSLDRPSVTKIKEMIDAIFAARISDKQLDESPLTLNELNQIAESFLFSLQSMLHTRVAYPKPLKESSQKNEETEIVVHNIKSA